MKRSTLIGVVVGVAVVGLAVVGYRQLQPSPQTAAANLATPAARNEYRRAQLKLLATAIHQYLVDGKKLPFAIPAADTGICITTGVPCRTAKLIDFGFLPSQNYVLALPNDPSGGHGAYNSGFSVGRDAATGTAHLTAPRAEQGAVISTPIY